MNPFCPPHVGNALKRPRLFALLDQHRHRQNIIISGQAAQGKSTLVASYLESYPGHILWFHLMRDHENHDKLFDLFLQGIDSLSEPAGKDTRPPLPHTTLGTGRSLLRHTEALTTMLQNIKAPLIIVLDDLESIDETTSGFELIKRILETRFLQLHFFILTRHMPTFHRFRIKLEQHTMRLSNETLAFTLDETRQFFAEKSPKNSLEIEQIQTLTHGWAGGLTLVSQAMDTFREFKPCQHQLPWEVFRFFSQEIYRTLSPATRDFLMKTSILEIIEIEATNRIFEITDAVETLGELEKRNLFIHRTDNGGPCPTYKYHNLFRNFLFQDFAKTRGEAAVQELQKKAGIFYRDAGDHEQAMDYFIKAGTFPEVAHIIKKKGTGYVINQKMSRLTKWIASLPRDMVQTDPWLLFYLTMTRRIQGGKKNIRDLKKAVVMFEEHNDVRGMLLSMGFLIEAAVFVRQPSGMILHWIQKGEKVLREIRHQNRFAWARALLWQQMGLGYIAGYGNIPKGVSACKNAILLGGNIHNDDLVLNASVTLTFGYVQAGDFAGARRLLTQIEKMTRKGRHPEYRALKGIVDIDFALKKGQFSKAEKLLIRSEKEIDKFGLIFLYPGFVEAGALHLLYTGQFDHARQMADHLNDFSILEGNDFYKGIAHRIKALSYLKAKMSRQAVQEIRQAQKELDQAKKGDIHYYLTQQLAGTIFFCNEEFAKAKQCLLPVLDYFKNISSDLCFCETSIVLGLIAWENNDTKEALFHLKAGVERIRQEAYDFFPLLNDTMRIRAMLVLTALGKKDHVGTGPGGLIQENDAGLILREMASIPDHGSPSPREKSKRLENLHPLYKQQLSGIRIETLGRFMIHAGETVLDQKAFVGSKPILLLKSIIHHGAKDIPKEILIDDLWPDAATTAGEKNFKINLHRLRKGFEPHPSKDFGYSYILQKAGLISLDKSLVSLDVDEFMVLGTRAMEYERDNRFKSALACYDQVDRLYKGDYFAEEAYVEWIFRKRELFKARFMALMQKKARLHEELDQTDRAVETWHRILSVDPCFEAAYRNLMILYADAGEKHKALELFSQCRNILQKELATVPDDRTMVLYHQIQAR